MLLKALKDYSTTVETLPDFHTEQRVRYAFYLDKDGNLTDILLLQDPERPKLGVLLTIPTLPRTSKPPPLPIDKAEFVIGLSGLANEDPASEAKLNIRAAERHMAYVALLKEAAKATELQGFRAAHRFAASVSAQKLDLPIELDFNQFIALHVEGKLITQDPAARAWWIGRCKAAAGVALDRTCGVCGARSSPEENMPVPIKGLTRIGGQATMALVSGNAEVFERHGMIRATGASICIECANATHQMLNQLIASEEHSFSYGSGVFVWWSIKEVDDIIGALWSGDTDRDVRDALQSLLTGGRPDINLTSSFVGVTLGANASRVIVRTWLDMTIGEALHNVDRWFARITVVGRDGITTRYPNTFTLLASISPPGQGSPLSRLRPDIVDSAIRAALDNQVLPPMVLTQTLGRLRATGGEITSSVAALLKACITPVNSSDPEAFMTSLDETSTNEAYLCGRLLALLDNAARLATSANNSLVDRSYAAASTMPQITLTRLLRLHRAHLEKLKRDKPGAAFRIDRGVGAVMDGLNQFPKTLSVEGQARFALGLYHQQAADRAAIQKAKEAKALGEFSGTIEDEEEEML